MRPEGLERLTEDATTIDHEASLRKGLLDVAMSDGAVQLVPLAHLTGDRQLDLGELLGERLRFREDLLSLRFGDFLLMLDALDVALGCTDGQTARN